MSMHCRKDKRNSKSCMEQKVHFIMSGHLKPSEGKQSSPKTNKRTSLWKSQSYDAVDNIVVVVVHLLRYMMESCWRNTA